MRARSWKNQGNSKVYHEYASSSALYRESCKSLLTDLIVEANSLIVDLACGTGVSTGVIAEVFPNARVTGVDSSSSQISIALTQSWDPTINFVLCRAEDIDRLSLDTVELVVCNAAFWYFDLQLVLQSINKIIRPGGHLRFNLPPQYCPRRAANCGANDTRVEMSDDPVQEMLQFLGRDRGVWAAENVGHGGPMFEEQLETQLALNSFAVDRTDAILIRETVRERLGWFRIPLFRASYFPTFDARCLIRAVDAIEGSQGSELLSPRLCGIAWSCKHVPMSDDI